MELRIEADLDIEKIVQPSDIGAIIPLNANVILITDGSKHYVNSTNFLFHCLYLAIIHIS